MSRTTIESIKNALKLISSVEDGPKGEGLTLLNTILSERDRHLTELGYDGVIFKELMKLIQFDSGQSLKMSLVILESYYFDDKNVWDEMTENLIYRVARTNDVEVCSACLEKISSLVDKFDDSITKHSKQLLKLADLNDIASLNPILIEILVKMKGKLPKRKLENIDT